MKLNVQEVTEILLLRTLCKGNKLGIIFTFLNCQLMNKFNKKLTISVPEEDECEHDQLIKSSQPSLPEKESLLQFKDYRDGLDSEAGDTREHPSSKINYVEFEEFNVTKFDPRESLKTEGDHKKTPKHKRNFTIEVPDRDGENLNDKRIKNIMSFDDAEENQAFKEPPAPSKGSKMNKVFVFPTSPHKPQSKYELDEGLEEIKRSFERERQQFYKEKSKLQKQILIKNGQIDMLQKIVKDKYSFEAPKEKRYYEHGPEENYQRLENILMEKDIEINEMLEKIAYLSEILSKKNEEYNKKLIENANLESIVESLKNQIFLMEKKEVNEKLSKKFYYYQKERDRLKSWEEQDDIVDSSNMDFGRKGIDQLNKRIDVIRNNRREINSRQKINSEYSSYSQSTKNRPKGAFDFKGKAHDETRLNKTRIF